MSIFGEVQSPRGRVPEGLDPSDLRKFLRTGALVVAVIVAALIFFNYVAAITRIGAGYVGVEVMLVAERADVILSRHGVGYQPEVGISRYRGGTTVQERDTGIGTIVFLLMQVRHDQ